MLTIPRDLNVYSSGMPPIISLSQYDSDFQLVFNLYTSEGTLNIPSGTTAQIQGTKRDGNGYSASATISGNTVTVTGDNQITACAGANVFEISLINSGKVLNTINFIMAVEPAALDAGTIQSETVLKELQAIIDSAAISTQAAQDAEDAADRAEEAARSLTVDPTLTQSGQPADAKVTGDEIADLKADLSEVEGLSDNIKSALLTCFRHVAWLDYDEDYYAALQNALYAGQVVGSIDAVFTQGEAVIHSTDSLDVLRQHLVVTAHMQNGKTKTVYDYTLSGDLNNSQSVITVHYADKTATFTVAVTVYSVVQWDYSLGRLPSADDGIEYTYPSGVADPVSFDSAKGLRYNGESWDLTAFSPKDHRAVKECVFECTYTVTTTDFGTINWRFDDNQTWLRVYVGVSNGQLIGNSNATNDAVIAPYPINTERRIKIHYRNNDVTDIYMEDSLVYQIPANYASSTQKGTGLYFQGPNDIYVKSFKWTILSE